MTARELPEAALALIARDCSNVGRWGPADEKGTLNLITPEVRRRAAALVSVGRSVALGRMPPPGGPGVELRMKSVGEAGDLTCQDSVSIDCHTLGLTHLDALGHVYLDGRLYNGRRADEYVTESRLRFADVHALREGIFTRGIVLDICAVRGVDWLEPGAKIFSSDLEAAEELAGVRVTSGDAIFVHCGTERREQALGPEDPAFRPGLAAEAIPWIHARDIAVYSGDCFEALPSGFPEHPLPLHMIGSSAMGLVLLDNPSMSELIAVCAELRRSDFLFTCAPLPIVGATGSALNPLAVF